MFSSVLFRKVLISVIFIFLGYSAVLLFFCFPLINPELIDPELVNTELHYRIILFLIPAFSVSIIIIILFLNHILRPITHLKEIAEQYILKGDISFCSYITGKGEIGTLGSALHKMGKNFGLIKQKLLDCQNECNELIRENELTRERAYDYSLVIKRLEQKIENSSAEEASLRKSEDRYRAMLENIEEFFYEVDLLGNLIFFNDAFYKMMGYSKDELVGMNFREFTDEETEIKAFQTFEKAYETGKPRRGFEWRLIRKDGTVCYVEISVSLIKDDSDEVIGFRGIARDISDLLFLVYHDSLTGLYNRKAFFQRLKETLAFAKRDQIEKNIFYLDLDRFKQVNDNFGHDIGDEVLKEVAIRLKASLRETDHVCRLGGDEFTVILNNAQPSCPETAAIRIIENLSQPYRIKDHVVDFISPSIGISAYPKDAVEIEELIKCADIAMYEAKKEHGSFIFYDKSMEGVLPAGTIE
ncbi:diguanylate cyclase [Desulfobacterales bacterium HSG17]|nr:diguanylate cyclase [Desulfobacterales bacterium HSG17]